MANQAISSLLRASSRLSGAESDRSDSPWGTSDAREKQARADQSVSHWTKRARDAEKEVKELRAALAEKDGVRDFMEHS